MPKVLQPAPFQISYFPKLACRANGRAWGVRQGSRWRFAREVLIHCPVITDQNTLSGVGIVRTLARGRISVNA